MPDALPAAVRAHLDAVNAGDLDGVMSTFADDPFVAAQFQARGRDAVRALIAREFIDDRVTLEVRETSDHHGDCIVRVRYDGDYDKTGLPDPLIMTNYYGLRDGKIITLAVSSGAPVPAPQTT